MGLGIMVGCVRASCLVPPACALLIQFCLQILMLMHMCTDMGIATERETTYMHA